MGFKITIASLLLIACGVVMSFKIPLVPPAAEPPRPVGTVEVPNDAGTVLDAVDLLR